VLSDPGTLKGCQDTIVLTTGCESLTLAYPASLLHSSGLR